MTSPHVTVSAFFSTVSFAGALGWMPLMVAVGVGCAGGLSSSTAVEGLGASKVGEPIDAEAVVAASDRTAKDREADRRRHPVQLLEFLDLRQGAKVADLGAGGGYTTELLARAVGPEGSVFGQNSSLTIEKYVGETWPARLKQEANRHVVRMDLEYEAPFVPEAVNLDLVTLMFSYHDIIAQGGDRAEMNVAIFSALKPGGRFVVADHSAELGSGLEAAGKLHRIEMTIVRREIEAAGFQFVSSADFLKDETDNLTTVSYETGFLTDRYILKFVKPE